MNSLIVRVVVGFTCCFLAMPVVVVQGQVVTLNICEDGDHLRFAWIGSFSDITGLFQDQTLEFPEPYASDTEVGVFGGFRTFWKVPNPDYGPNGWQAPRSSGEGLLGDTQPTNIPNPIGYQTTNDGRIIIPVDYVAGDPISGNVIVPNRSFADFNLVDGVTNTVSWVSGGVTQTFVLRLDQDDCQVPSCIEYGLAPACELEPAATIPLSKKGKGYSLSPTPAPTPGVQVCVYNPGTTNIFAPTASGKGTGKSKKTKGETVTPAYFETRCISEDDPELDLELDEVIASCGCCTVRAPQYGENICVDSICAAA